MTLLNASADPVDLTGWRVSDRLKRSAPVVAAGQPGCCRRVRRSSSGSRAEVALGNSGGTITLLDAAGLKVDGVSYTKAQVAREGWTVVF